MSNPLSSPLPWDLVAQDYARDVLPHLARYAADALRLADVRAGQRLVDVACGPGTLSLQAAALGCRVDALDFSAEMVALLRAHGASGVTVTQGDGQALPYPDGAFDVGCSMFGLIFFPDRVQGLRELRRVVRPGGPVVIGSWLAQDQVPELAAIFAAIQEALPGPPAPAGPAPLSTEALIDEEARAAGFTQVAVHACAYALEAPSAAAFVAAMERSLAPLALLRQKLGEGWPAVWARISAGALSRMGDGPIAARMPAYVSVLRA